ncbi:unnamed protein product [Microthlaspi erraticum]|uniref:DUF4283 domain-containing protein n=1 Tax=Microthlaspi erraticum TaxID=1685480 RepID=A0A6D2I4P7_9BRAS|nr:unnamed protein product [Microthlaspi erraticum]
MLEALPLPPIPPDPSSSKSVEIEMSDSPIASVPTSSVGSVPTVSAAATPLGHRSGFNWAKNLSSSGKIPESQVPVSISDSGRPRVKVSNEVFERGAKLHSDYVVGIFYGKPPSYGKIWGVLNYLWGKDKRVMIHNLTINAFLFHIPSPSLRRKILQHELWRLGDSPFFVTEWRSEFSFNPPSLNQAPVWTNVKGIPFDLLTPEGLAIACKHLGRAVEHKPFRSISSADVKVVVDLTKPLPPEVELERDDGKVLILQITYPWLPPFCDICGEFGHKESLCPRVYGPENKPRGFGQENKSNKPLKGSIPKQSQSPTPEQRKAKVVPNGNESQWKQVVKSSSGVKNLKDHHPIQPGSSHSDPSSANPCLDLIPVFTQKAHVSADKGPMDLVVADNSLSSSQKASYKNPSHSSSSTKPRLSNSFDMLSEDNMALVILEDSAQGVDYRASSNVPKKKRKVYSSSTFGSCDDPPPDGEMHHNH